LQLANLRAVHLHLCEQRLDFVISLQDSTLTLQSHWTFSSLHTLCLLITWIQNWLGRFWRLACCHFCSIRLVNSHHKTWFLFTIF
jgi:hypothetical protein